MYLTPFLIPKIVSPCGIHQKVKPQHTGAWRTKHAGRKGARNNNSMTSKLVYLTSSLPLLRPWVTTASTSLN